MQLSQKQKTFLKVLADFWKFILNFKCFEKKNDPHRYCIFEITDSENGAR